MRNSAASCSRPGPGSRFGGAKLVALLEGRPVLQHVLDTLAAVRPVVTIVVVAPGDDAWGQIRWRDAQRVVNPDPGRGLSSSLRLGIEAAAAGDLDGVLILLGDQPRTAVSTLHALVAAARVAVGGVALAVVPSYREGGGSNPVLLLKTGFPLAGLVGGDRGLGGVLAARPDRVHRRSRCRAPTPTWIRPKTYRRWSRCPLARERPMVRRGRAGRYRRWCDARCAGRCGTGGAALGAGLAAATLGAGLPAADAAGLAGAESTGAGEATGMLMSLSSQAVRKSPVQMSAAVFGPNASPATMVSATERVPATEPSRVTTTADSSSDGMSAVPLLTGVVVRPSGSPCPVASPQATTAASCACAVGGAKVVSSWLSMSTCCTPVTEALPPVTNLVAGTMSAARQARDDTSRERIVGGDHGVEGIRPNGGDGLGDDPLPLLGRERRGDRFVDDGALDREALLDLGRPGSGVRVVLGSADEHDSHTTRRLGGFG